MKLNKSKNKVLSISVLTMLVVSLFSSQFMVRAEDDDFNILEFENADGNFSRIEADTSDNVDIVNLDPIYEDSGYGFGGEGITADSVKSVKSTLEKGILIPNKGSNVLTYLYPTSTSKTAATYISGSITYNGIFPFYAKENSRYLTNIAGYEGWVDEGSFDIYLPEELVAFNHYKVTNGKLIHYIARTGFGSSPSYSAISNGPAPDYLEEGKIYYSSDGHYFYDKMSVMIEDYANEFTKAGDYAQNGSHRLKSINVEKPFYNYFQFLSYRSTSNLTGDDFDKYLKDKKGFTSRPTSYEAMTSTQSQLFGLGKFTVEDGNKFGTNPAITFGIAINESGWGRSYYSVEKNNLFGHSAFDSAPGNAAHYKTPEDGVNVHQKRETNWNFVNYKRGNYYGGYLGNKNTGINVKYASDPFWGEKAAAHYYDIDSSFGYKDYNKQIMAFSTVDGVNIRFEPTTKTGEIMSSLKKKNMGVLVLSKVKGESLDGNDIWYKIASDSVVNPDRSIMVSREDESHFNEAYNRELAYYYVHSSNFILTSDGSGLIEEFIKGDLNKDGLIDISDMMVIRRHILNIKPLAGIDYERANLNNDNAVDISDMMIIRRHILGIKPIN